MQIASGVSPAFERMRAALFRPFEIGRWLAFGFVFFIAALVDPIGSYNGRLDLPSGKRGAPVMLPEIGDLPPEIRDHLATMAIAFGLMLVVGTAVAIALAWVGARGLMMAYRSVSSGFVAIGESWRETARPANQLFRVYLVTGAIGGVLGLPLVALAGVQAFHLYDSGERDLAVFVRGAIPFLLALGGLGLAMAVVGFVVRQFIAPFLLFFPTTSVREAFSRFFAVLRADPASVIGFFFARVVLAVIVGILSSIIGTCTCCIGSMPVLHQTVLAPVLFFDRAFTLEVLASIGPEYASLSRR